MADALSPPLGVSRAFLVSAAGEDQQYDREANFIESASKAGVELVVRVSTADFLINPDHGVYAKAHYNIERFVEKHNYPVVDLRPNWFFTNWLWGQNLEAQATGQISWPVNPLKERGTEMVDPRDVASAGVLILLSDDIDDFLRKGYVIVNGPEPLRFVEKAARLSVELSDHGKQKVYNASCSPAST